MSTVYAPRSSETPAAPVSGQARFFGNAFAVIRATDESLPLTERLAIGVPTPKVPDMPLWFAPTIQSMLSLPWDDDNWNDDAKPTDPAAAANLLILLASILDDAAPTPIIVPTWRGGVQAEWHLNDVDLEIEVDPDGTIYYSFENPVVECEGPIADDLSELLGYIAHLPHRFSENGGAR